MLAKETAAPGHDSPAQEGTQSNDGNIRRPRKSWRLIEDPITWPTAGTVPNLVF